jgi:hypothetical protein
VLEQASAAVEAAAVAVVVPGLLQEGEVRGVAGVLGEVAARVQALLVAVLVEAFARGLPVQDGFGDVDWVRLVVPGLSGRAAGEVACVARAGQDRVHAPVLAAVAQGRVPVPRAAAVLRALGRVRAAVGPGEYAEAVDLMVGAAASEGFDDRDLARVAATLVATCLSRREQQQRERVAHELRDLHESSLGDGSVRRFVLTVGDDSDYQVLRAVLMSPLAAPATGEESAAVGVPDTRTAGQRRYDAVLTVLRRGVAGTRGQPTTPKAQVMVTVSLDALRAALAGVGGQVGCTMEGAPVPAAQVLRWACEADLIPAVLGGEGEVLHLGRSRRLVTPGQRRALAHRDGGCTFPGCTIPATWADAHHVVHWARGGRSDLDNYALLCPRHHTWVHQHDTTATITTTGVTWHLR